MDLGHGVCEVHCLWSWKLCLLWIPCNYLTFAQSVSFFSIGPASDILPPCGHYICRQSKWCTCKQCCVSKNKTFKTSIHWLFNFFLLPGATRDIGSALTRMCMRHRSIESKLRHFTKWVIDPTMAWLLSCLTPRQLDGRDRILRLCRALIFHCRDEQTSIDQSSLSKALMCCL